MIAAELRATRLCFGGEDITSIYADRFRFVHSNANDSTHVTDLLPTPLSGLPRGQPPIRRRRLRSSTNRGDAASPRWDGSPAGGHGVGRPGAGFDQVAVGSIGRV